MNEKQEVTQTIPELLYDLALAREEEEALEARAGLFYDAMMATDAGKRLDEANAAHDAKRREIIALDAQVRDAILANFTATGDRKPATGAGIRITKGRINISNAEAALWWAKKNMPVAVIESIDKKRLVAEAGFKLKAGGELPEWAAKSEDRIIATIGKDLSFYLNAEEVIFRDTILK